MKTVTNFLEEGKVRPAGIESVEAAKRDGRWERAYDGSRTVEVPEDFWEAVRGDDKARVFLKGLGRSERYALSMSVHTANPNSRARRVERVVGLLAERKFSGVRAKTRAEDKKEKPKEKKVGVVKKGAARVGIWRAPARKALAKKESVT